MGNMADADRAAGAERKAGARALALENQRAARELNTTNTPMFITEAYRILISLKLHGAEASKITPAQIANAKSVVSANAASDPLYRKVLRDLAKAGR